VCAETSFQGQSEFISPNPTISLDDPIQGPGDNLLWPGSGDGSSGDRDSPDGGRYTNPYSQYRPGQPDPGSIPDQGVIPSPVFSTPSLDERYSYPNQQYQYPCPYPTTPPYIPPTPTPTPITRWCEPSVNIYPVYEDPVHRYRYSSYYDKDYYSRSYHDKDWYRTGAIQIISTPARAEVYVNNKYRGKVPHSGYLEIDDLIPGSYQVRVEYSGYQSYIRTVDVERDEMETISAVLNKISEQVPLESSLQINSEPTGANVFVDNEYRGITPVTLKNLASGEHTIILQKSGYIDFVSKVQSIEGQTLPVTGILIGNPPKPTPLPEVSVTPTPTPVPEATKAGFPTGLLIVSLIIGRFMSTLRERK
jgi:hypothetical protein